MSASKGKIELLAVAVFVSIATMPASLGTPASPRSIDAILAERLAVLNAERGASLPSSARLSADDDVGLLDVSGRDTIALPTAAVGMTRSVRELDFLLRIKIMALRAGEAAGPSRQGRFLAGLAGLYASEAVSSRDRLDRARLPVRRHHRAHLGLFRRLVRPDRAARHLATLRSAHDAVSWRIGHGAQLGEKHRPVR